MKSGLSRLGFAALSSLLLGCTQANNAPPEQGQSAADGHPLRIAIVGLVHGHVRGHMTAMAKRPDVQLVGVYDPDAALRQKFATLHQIEAARLFDDLDRLITITRPEALVVYTNTFDHLKVVETASRHGVHVMMEKPLAVSTAHAKALAEAARRGRIHVLVNYETTWYRSHRAIWRLMHDDKMGGRIRKIVAMDGHFGPKEIGVPPEFLDWLSDPARNGAGALYDFGCYGASIATWLLDNQRPLRVTAVTQRHKPDIYARVDDEATIVLEYAGAQAIIEASWNWPDHRKDLEVYTDSGAAWATRGELLRTKLRGQPIADAPVEDWPTDEQNALNYLTAVVRGRLTPSGPTSIENNLIVSEILDAARESARAGRTVVLPR
jgi:predicted dehydrogenase